jgi:hypothetical protein
MKNTPDDDMTEILIGEAVTELLETRAAISWNALLQKLQSAMNNETSEVRIRAMQRAIDEVRQEMQSKTGEKETKPGTVQSEAWRPKLH